MPELSSAVQRARCYHPMSVYGKSSSEMKLLTDIWTLVPPTALYLQQEVFCWHETVSRQFVSNHSRLDKVNLSQMPLKRI